MAFILKEGISMASDDMFMIIYCILKKLYECKKKGIRVCRNDISHKRFGIPYSYWIDIMMEMQKKGYVDGVMCRSTKGTGKVLNYDDIDITFEGIEYLHENSMMKKGAEALKKIKDIVPMI